MAEQDTIKTTPASSPGKASPSDAEVDGRWTLAELTLALGGDAGELSRLVSWLTPVVQARVARVLLRHGPMDGRDVRQEVEDLAQEVFVALFADDARVLRGWDPERGLSLRNFAGLVAERQSLSILRSGKRNPWTEDPTLNEELDRPTADAGPDDVVVSRQLLRVLLRRLEEQLSPLGRQLFELIFLRECSVTAVGDATGMSADAIYAWRSRLRRLSRRLLSEVLAEQSVSDHGVMERTP